MLTWKQIRLFILISLLVLSTVCSSYQLTYSRNWGAPLDIVIFPIAVSPHNDIDKYIKSLSNQTFKPIDQWLGQQAKSYDLPNPDPINTRLGERILTLPPAFPNEPKAWSVMLWGLQMRWWAFRNTPDDPNLSWRSVKIFVVYHLGKGNKNLPHSLGMQKGLIGLVHAFALPRQTAQNNIVIAHEMLHTVGASDKYDFMGEPQYPTGFANPNRSPLLPQRSAEIMAGRIPISRYKSIMAHSLRSSEIGPLTAKEINWLRAE